MKRLRRLLFGPGQLPEDLRAALTAEGLVLLDEGLPGTITYRGRRAGGRRSSWTKDPTIGAIAVTGRRLVVWAGHSKHIDVLLADPRRTAIQISAQRRGRLCFAFDAGAFDPAHTGRVELRLRPADAARVTELLASA